MIVVTVEVWPGGKFMDRRIVGVMQIVNDGTGTQALGNYGVSVGGEKATQHVYVRGHPRLEAGPWDLVLKALAAVRGKRGRLAL